MAQIVPIDRVIPRRTQVSTRIMRRVLEKQGQIEPLQVTQEGQYYVVFACDPYGDEIVAAARELAWPTLLIAVTDEYEQ